MKTQQEIERKFIIKSIPEHLEAFERKYVYQNYLSIAGEEEIRLRKQDEEGRETYDITYKSGSGLTREEVKFPIQRELYDDLTEKANSKSIQKFRQFYSIDGYQVMIDCYLNSGLELITAEIEFESEEQANKFQIPDWFGQEVTYDEKFKNKKLWEKIQ